MGTGTMNAVSTTSVEAYMLSYFNTLQTLESAREELREMASDEQVSESEQAQAAAGFLDMAVKIGHLKDAHSLILARFSGGVTPPSAELIAQSRRLSQQLAADIAAANTAVAILQIATKVTDGWNALADHSAVAPAAPQAAGAAKAGAPALPDREAMRMTERTVHAPNLEFLGTFRK